MVFSQSSVSHPELIILHSPFLVSSNFIFILYVHLCEGVGSPGT